MKIVVPGAGSWGMVVARLLADKGYDLVMCTNSKNQYKVLQESEENPAYLPGVSLPESLSCILSLKCTEETEITVSTVPTSTCREALGKIKRYSLKEDIIPVNPAKEIKNKSLKRVSEIPKEILGDFPFVRLSGPSYTGKAVKDIPARVTVACQDMAHTYKIQNVFSIKNFRVYTSYDLVGAGLGGTLKNTVALAADISNGLKFGDNTKAVFMTRGICKISKFAIEVGEDPQTFHGLVGMGDLIITCTSMRSRSCRCGTLIGQGLGIEEASHQVGMVVEGIKTTKSTYNLTKELSVDTPITNKLYGVLYEDEDPLGAARILTTRDSKGGIEEVLFP